MHTHVELQGEFAAWQKAGAAGKQLLVRDLAGEGRVHLQRAGDALDAGNGQGAGHDGVLVGGRDGGRGVGAKLGGAGAF